MILKPTDLLKYNPCDEEYQWFQKTYPNGASLEQIMRENPNLSLDALHFGHQYLRPTPEEEQLYRERCNIDDVSTNIIASDHISHSHMISNSSNISDSSYVRRSRQVKGSTYVANSNDITESHNIDRSNNIRDSISVIDSSYIESSEQILVSKHISWSQIIMNSTGIEGAQRIYNSTNCKQIFCSGFLTNCNYCLFSTNLQDKEYYIFNQSVSAQEYRQTRDVLEQMLMRDNGERFITIDYNHHNPQRRFLYDYRLDSVFRGLSKEFYGWIGTIPQFNEDIFMQVFFSLEHLLENKT